MPKRHRFSLKSKDAKKLLLEVSKRLGTDIEKFFDSKTRVEVNAMETVEIFIFNGRPLLARSNADLFPTLSFKEIFPIIPKIVVDMGAVPYVCKGADVMVPGVLSTSGEFRENDLLLVVDERHGKPLAIGISLLSSDVMKTVKHGKAMKNLHYVGDRLWNWLRAF